MGAAISTKGLITWLKSTIDSCMRNYRCYIGRLYFSTENYTLSNTMTKIRLNTISNHRSNFWKTGLFTIDSDTKELVFDNVKNNTCLNVDFNINLTSPTAPSEDFKTVLYTSLMLRRKDGSTLTLDTDNFSIIFYASGSNFYKIHLHGTCSPTDNMQSLYVQMRAGSASAPSELNISGFNVGYSFSKVNNKRLIL